jgi:glycosyltransferase involved in cell wall biosynthesis
MQQRFVETLTGLFPGLNVVIISFQYPFFEKAYSLLGATVISCNGRNRGGIRGYFLKNKVKRILSALYKRENIIGILSFWHGSCAEIGESFANKHGLLHYCWVLGQDARKSNAMAAHAPISGENLVALSDTLREEYEKSHGIRPLTVIPPGLDIMKGNNQVKRDIDILGAGSLIPLKQYEVFLQVIAGIKKTIPGISCILCGEGPERAKLEALIDSLELSSNVKLAGEIPQPEVLQLMQRTKIFLHPSSYEGFSGVCQEALAGGAHVISFCAAMKDEIKQWHIVRDEKEMEDKALELLMNNQLRYEAYSFMSMEDTVRRMMELFNYPDRS